MGPALPLTAAIAEAKHLEQRLLSKQAAFAQEVTCIFKDHNEGGGIAPTIFGGR